MAFFRRKKDPAQNLAEALGDADLPSFSSVVFQVLEALRGGEASPKEIGELISSDPGLSLRVLKMANSAAYGERRIQSAVHAVVLMGPRPVESLVLSVAVRDSLPQAPAKGFVKGRFWRTAARRATLAQGLAGHLHPATAAMSFTAALLQDMAVPLLAHSQGEDYGTLLEEWHTTGGDLAALERAAAGWDHAEVAGWLCEAWNFPPALTRAISQHHDLDAEGVPPAVGLVALLGEGEENPGLDALEETARLRFHLSPEKLRTIVERSLQEAEELGQLFVGE